MDEWMDFMRQYLKSRTSLCEGECGQQSPGSLLLTAQAVLASLPPRAGLGAATPLDAVGDFLSAFMVASSGSPSSGKGARRLYERPCRRVWVSLSRRNRFDIRFHHDCRGAEVKVDGMISFSEPPVRTLPHLQASLFIERHRHVAEGLPALGPGQSGSAALLGLVVLHLHAH